MTKEPFDESTPDGGWKAIGLRLAEQNRRHKLRALAISKPLEAYLVGLHSHGVPLALAVEADTEETADQLGVYAVIDRLLGAVTTLKEDIDARLRSELIGVLKELKYCVGDRSRRAKGSRLVLRLRKLADQALGAENPEQLWYGLGAAMGDYRRALRATPSSSKPSSNPSPVPDFDPIIGSVTALPEAALKRVPLLRSMATMGRDLEQAGALVILTRFIGENPDAWSFPFERVDELTVASMMTTLVDQICEALRPKEGQLQKPIWDSKAGTLSMRLKTYDAEPTVIRRVYNQGEIIGIILDKFQQEGWPDAILDPLTIPPLVNRRRLGKAADSLNVNLIAIRFFVPPGGRLICWERLPES